MIQAQGVAFAYAGGQVLRFHDVAVEQGGTVLLRGPSGSGKSTWLALAAGLLTPTAGVLQVADQDVAMLSRSARDDWRARTVGFLPQKLHLSEALTVADNLALAFFAAGLPVDNTAIAQGLAALGVGDLATRKPVHLSGGQAQRVALARALLLRPRVVLADEPTASLDDDACATALQRLQRSAQACGATLVVATHDARVLQALPQAQVLAFDATAREVTV
ncbi:MAG: ATP-binding cassette domain-containing protein [Hydrogenophaga sp.]|uniref:ABC transporter ATP-binding protein n=1 Tax=Hydrogenophaga sp. TaxID=1904254 RepID=UPI0027230238|nr:ATP-binding cassette domain-containing protein [Hydrogenophaga sp.]MDO9568426.1 ATP-binding cassette domain-containing protein [Hydrogenophaga sp.]MDP3373088.1 ATP-binding cassette domain-containing protein [Hydrogenophaga sp.]